MGGGGVVFLIVVPTANFEQDILNGKRINLRFAPKKNFFKSRLKFIFFYIFFRTYLH